MHDPMTVAHEIRYPWKKYGKSGRGEWERNYRESFLTIWHRDPEQGGSDDSCDWFGGRRHRTEEQKALVLEMAKSELRSPYYTASWLRPVCRDLEYPQMVSVGPGDGLALILTAYQTFAWRLEKRRLRNHEIQDALRVACNSYDNFQSSFVLHSVGYGGDQLDQLKGLFSNLLGCWLRNHRSWYQHPRWHIWHWSLQVHPLQAFKRWAFSRCQGCGKRFSWGYCPVSGSWYGKGPRWFRKEPHVFHSECFPAPKQVGHPVAPPTDPPGA